MNPTEIEITVISDIAIAGIKGNNKLMAYLMLAFDKTQNTIENWMASKDVRLTTPTAVQIIAKELQLSEDQILIKVVKNI